MAHTAFDRGLWGSGHMIPPVMAGQAFFTTVAGMAVSLAGFGSVIAWLRDDPSSWDPVNLWRVKTIVRHALILAFLCLALIPVFSITNDDTTTIRVGSGFILMFAVADAWYDRHPDPVIWVPRASWVLAMAITAVIAVIALANLVWVSLGILQLEVLVLLTSPAGIFFNFVREMSAGPRAAPGKESD